MLEAPEIELYDGTTNLEDHIASFCCHMYLQDVDNPMWCRCFPSTLKGVVQQWFNNLPNGSIRCFNDLNRQFCTYFVMNKHERKTNMYVETVVHGEIEGLVAL